MLGMQVSIFTCMFKGNENKEKENEIGDNFSKQYSLRRSENCIE
jgi:hypothetical protein